MKRLACQIALLTMPTVAFAAGIPPHPAEGTALDFSVQFAKSKTTLDYASGASVNMTFSRLGVAWYERVSPRVELGLFGGRAYATQTDNITTAGLEPEGYYAGIGVRGVITDTSLLQIYFHAAYEHQRLSAEDSQRSVTFSLDQPQAQLGIISAPTGALRLYGGALWSTVDGQERLTGASARTTNFDGTHHVGGFAGLDYTVERDGHVGIEVRSGVERGGEIYFKRHF